METTNQNPVKSNNASYTHRPRLRWFLAQFLIILGIIGAIWWHYQGYAWWLTRNLKFEWGESAQNYKVSTNLKFEAKNVQVASADYGIYLPQKDFSLNWEDFRLSAKDDFLGQSNVNLNIQGQGATDLLFHYRKVGDLMYFIPHIFGTEEQKVLADRVYGPPYTTLGFAWGNSLTNPNNNNGLSEDEIFALYDYMALGEQAWASVNNNANKAKSFLYLDPWGKDNNADNAWNIFPAPAYFITPSFPSGMGNLPAYSKPDGSPFAYIQNDAYYADLLGMIEDFYAGLDAQNIDLGGIFLDDWYEASDVWETTMADDIEAIAWPGRGQDEAGQENWWINEQYPRMLQFEHDLHDLTVQYFGASTLIINGPMRQFRTLPSGLREPYYYNNPLYTPNKISIRCFEGPTVSTNNYANFPEMVLPQSSPNYKYWRAFFPKDLLLMYSIDGTVNGQNGEYGDWINEPPRVGAVDWPYATNLANDNEPDTMVALAYGSTPATGGSRLSLFTDPMDWPFAVQPPVPACGDGSINQPSEECDDGNNQDGDGCSSICQIEEAEPPAPRCGDGSINQASEECDDGDNQNGDGCSSICQIEEAEPPAPACGDGSINQASEECDDGDNQNGDGCSSTCQIEEDEAGQAICGDGLVTQPQEQCDDDNTQNGDGCSSLCQIEEDDEVSPICGDGEINQGFEQCDDGNIINNDGCTSICQLEENAAQEEPEEEPEEEPIQPEPPVEPPLEDPVVPEPAETPAQNNQNQPSPAGSIEEEVDDAPPVAPGAPTIFDFPKIDDLPQANLQSEWAVSGYRPDNFILNSDASANQVLETLGKPNIFNIKDTHQSINSADGKLRKIQYSIKGEDAERLLAAIASSYWGLSADQVADWKTKNSVVWRQWKNFIEQVDFYLWINTKTKNIHGLEISKENLAVDIGNFKGDVSFTFEYLLLSDDINNVPEPQNTMTVAEFLNKGALDQILSDNLIYADSLKNYFMSYDSVDSDADGLSAGEEAFYGTDSQDADSDDDGYSDGQEIDNGYNPLGDG